MSEIIRTYCEPMPASVFIGHRYTESEKTNGSFAEKWSMWWERGLFDPLFALETPEGDWAGVPCGLCRCKEGEPGEYWLGAFFPAGTAAPDGYGSLGFAASKVAVCWIKGTEPDIYFHCCLEALKSNGFEWAQDADGVRWMWERYNCPRYTRPDENGERILDSCYIV